MWFADLGFQRYLSWIQAPADPRRSQFPQTLFASAFEDDMEDGLGAREVDMGRTR